MRRRRTIAAAVALLFATALLVRHPTADIRIEAHDIGDPAPHQVQAAIDVGVFAVNVLVTWTGQRLGR